MHDGKWTSGILQPFWNKILQVQKSALPTRSTFALELEDKLSEQKHQLKDEPKQAWKAGQL